MILPPTFSKKKDGIHVVIETPQGSRNKYDYNNDTDSFELKKVLPSGTSFPLDFGFIPNTIGEDGDPLDVIIVSDSPFFPGCIVECRVVGVLVVKQKEKKAKAVRNDRFIAVPSNSLNFSNVRDIRDINKRLLNEVVHFFEYYNEMEGKKVQLIQKGNKSLAVRLIRKGQVKTNN
jgi:inorganic pyrophosphatase